MQTAYFNIELNVECPHCGHSNDLEDGDEGYWLGIFRDWINNKKDFLPKDADHYCRVCDHCFRITSVER